MIRISFWAKLFFIAVEVILTVAFGVCNLKGRYNAAAVLEWAIAFIFTFYVLSFAVDLWPAVSNRRSGVFQSSSMCQPQYVEPAAMTREMEEGESDRGLMGHGGRSQYGVHTSSNF